MTTAVATLDRNLAGTTTATPAIRPLTMEELGTVAGGKLSDTLLQTGTNLATDGAAVAATGAIVTQVDSPLIGPADVVGGAMIIFGAAEAAVGGVLAAAGAVLQLFGH